MKSQFLLHTPPRPLLCVAGPQLLSLGPRLFLPFLLIVAACSGGSGGSSGGGGGQSGGFSGDTSFGGMAGAEAMLGGMGGAAGETGAPAGGGQGGEAEGGAGGGVSGTGGLLAKRTMRIVPIGDSITQGRGRRPPEISYRYNLWKKFVDADVEVDFVGSLRGGFEGDPAWPDYKGKPFDRDHEGHWGWTLDGILGKLPGWLRGYDADIALIMLGTNDDRKGDNVANMVREAGLIIDALRADNPEIIVIWGHAFQEWDPFPEYRVKIQEMLDRKSTKKSPLLSVDHSPGWISDPGEPDTDTLDWVHTSTRGDEKIAQRFFDALMDL